MIEWYASFVPNTSWNLFFHLLLYIQSSCIINTCREEQDALAQKLAAIEKKIIVGGENLLEKAEEQERLLEESALELEQRKVKEEQLRKQLVEKEVGFNSWGMIIQAIVWFQVKLL